MAKKKKYRIYCQTEQGQRSGWTNLDEPPDQCPVNPAHTVTASSKCIEEVLSLDNLTATTDPTVNDDIDDGYAVGSGWVNTLTTSEFSCADNSPGAAVWTKLRKDLFGTEYNYAASEGESTTNSGSWQEKLTLSVSVSAGNYMVTWHWSQKGAAAKSIAGRVMQDDATELSAMQYNYITEYFPFAGMAQVTLTAGSHTFCIEHCSPNGATTSYVRRARIAIWRVS